MEPISVYWASMVLIVICTIIATFVIGKKYPAAREDDVIACGFKVAVIGIVAGLILLGIIYGIVYMFGLQFNIYTVLAIILDLAVTVGIVCFMYLYSDLHGRICH